MDMASAVKFIERSSVGFVDSDPFVFYTEIKSDFGRMSG